jgi:Skp family chaperone for outer membrane proteins
LKIGGTLTLSEQKKKEEQLQKRQQDLQQLEHRYAQQLMDTRNLRNQEVQDKIFAFVEEYNKAHDNFTIILSKARTSGVLYSLPSMDITGEVLEALNEDYAKNRKK